MVFMRYGLTQLTFTIIRSLLVKCLLLIGLLSCFAAADAQDYNAISFRIDSLADMGLPKSALQEVDKLDALARKNGNTSQQVRAVIYRMTFQSYLEEDALTSIISRLKADITQANYPVKPVLQSLLAKMYWNYYQQNRYQISQRSRLLKPDSDFTRWDLQTVIDETSRLYERSLNDDIKEQRTPVGVLDGILEGDSSTRYLRPTLFDLLVQRAFDFFLSDEASVNRPKLPFSLNDPQFFSDSRTFAGLQVQTTDTASTVYKGIKYLQQATRFHLSNPGEEALADLDLQRIKFLYDKSAVEHKDSLYLSALKQAASQFSTKPISSEALVLEGQYYQGIDSLTIAYGFFNEAIAAFPKSLGGKNAAILIKQLEEKELSATVENVSVPDKPILALISYRNVKKAELCIYPLTAKQAETAITDDRFTTASIAKLIKRIKPVQQQSYELPGTDDYRTHSAEIKINALPPGTYVVFVKDVQTNNHILEELATFKVSHLSYVARENPNGQTEFRVIDRGTGVPLSNVKINISMWKSDKNLNSVKSIIAEGLSDASGKFLIRISNYERYLVSLSNKSDSYSDPDEKYISGVTQTGTESTATVNTILFADRQLYRPGQTIYFKALHVSSVNGNSTILPHTQLAVRLTDQNYKDIGSLNLQTSEFGSAEGSFVIPQTIISGEVFLTTPNGRTVLRVEEYKRPTFEATFLPVTENFHVNDSVKIKGKITAFSGYGISNGRAAFHITRQVKPHSYNYRLQDVSFWGVTQEIETDTVTANDKGEFEIKFKAIPDDKGLPNDVYGYSVSADVTDESGETRSANTLVKVSNNPLEINAQIPEKLLFSDDPTSPIKLNNVNGQMQNGSINVKVFALQSPEKVFKNRLWDDPDNYIMAKAEFESAFPWYAWKKEDNTDNWKVLRTAAELQIQASDTAMQMLDLGLLKKQPGGVYKIVLFGKDATGDTTSLTQMVDFVSPVQVPQKTEDWIIPLATNLATGDSAKFLVGINRPANLLMEEYNGATLLKSEWLKLKSGNQQLISVPVPAGARRSFKIQFLMVDDNRDFRSYQSITVRDISKKLEIKFLTFRDKLQPGEKEQWKVRITSNTNEKLSAEMLADLYDASLDDIVPKQSWETSGYNGSIDDGNYFTWQSAELATRDETEAFDITTRAEDLIDRNYEQLYLFGYNYYGGDNSNYQDYLDGAEDRQKLAKEDKNIAEKYLKNAALVKNGFDVSGQIVSKFYRWAVGGARISIKNMSISTVSNSLGYFRIKVPANGVLIFKCAGYVTKEVKVKQGSGQIIVLADKGHRWEVADPGVKSIRGEKRPAVNQVKFPPPVVVADAEAISPKEEFKSAYGNVTLRGNRSAQYEQVNGLTGRVAGLIIQQGAPGAASDTQIRGIASPSSPIALRKNFNETAFFYPQLHTDDKGEILIDFTIPEALTRWRFRGFAHTQDLQTGYIETEVVTQKQLSISANTPRFLREGDTITISARLANLTAGKLSGKVQMQLFNALNMQPVNLFVNVTDASQDFEITANTNKAVSFKLVIPAGLDALDYKLTADAGTFSDGEENTLPVLPNRMLVTESMPMMVRPGQTRDFAFDKLVNEHSATLKNKTLTLEYTPNPAWYAVQALPYMMEFPYECSEQVFSQYFANSLAVNIVNKVPAIKQVFDQWKNANSTELLSNLEKNQDLKSTLIEETPWLRDAENETEQKKRIALLFDLNKMSDELKLNLDKLQKRQLPGGGFTWFGGDYPDRYITQHIAEGIGELYRIGIGKDNAGLKQVADGALSYLDNQIIADEQQRKKNPPAERFYSDMDIYAWYTRSFYLDKPIIKELQAAQQAYLKWAADAWKFRNAYEQGMIALTMQRYGKPDVTKQIERSLLETAQQSDDLGMYWANNQLGYYWYESPIETQSLLIALFTEAGDNTKAVDEMKIWLLRNKQTSDWKTTKATAAACYALLLKGSNVLADSGSTSIKIAGNALAELKPDTKSDAGTGYIKTSWVGEQIKPSYGKVEIANHGTTIGWGALHWQYLENLEKITSAQTNIHLQRKYFIQNQGDAGVVLTEVDATHQPKTGDLLKVVVYLKADRDFEYVQLKDMRPAGTEPVEALSAYKYQDGLYYYQVTKDVATNFFISELGKGSYVFEYALRVAQPGNFSTGITTIQCMYAPEFNAHSEGERIEVKP
jgi:uncharacterized protein YfaS (alpha-2-macroglobulin family)